MQCERRAAGGGGGWGSASRAPLPSAIYPRPRIIVDGASSPFSDGSFLLSVLPTALGCFCHAPVPRPARSEGSHATPGGQPGPDTRYQKRFVLFCFVGCCRTTPGLTSRGSRRLRADTRTCTCLLDWPECDLQICLEDPPLSVPAARRGSQWPRRAAAAPAHSVGRPKNYNLCSP